MDNPRWTAFRERLRIGGGRLRTSGAEMGKRVGEKMKEILQGPTKESKLVDEATSEKLDEGPNWGLNLKICGLLNSEQIDGLEVVKAIKKKMASSRSAVVRGLCLDLLECCATNFEKIFSELASERVLDEMARLAEDPHADPGNQRRCFQLIEAWGKSDDLAYLPVFKQTYETLKAKPLRGNLVEGEAGTAVQWPSAMTEVPEWYLQSDADELDADPSEAVGHQVNSSAEEEMKRTVVAARNALELLSSILNSEASSASVEDELLNSVAAKCRESQASLQLMIQCAADADEPVLFEALNLHDEMEQTLVKYEALKFPKHAEAPQPAVAVSVQNASEMLAHGEDESRPSEGN